jgi:hypothetical protein
VGQGEKDRRKEEVSWKKITWGALLWFLVPAGLMMTAAHQPQPAGKPFQLSPAAEARVADLRGRAQIIEERLTLDQDDATFKRAADEADKLTAEADAIESAELDKWIETLAAGETQGAK